MQFKFFILPHGLVSLVRVKIILKIYSCHSVSRDSSTEGIRAISAISDDSLIGIDSECGSFCFQSIQPVTDLLEIEGKPNSPNSPNMSASLSDVLTDFYEVDESLSGVDSE